MNSFGGKVLFLDCQTTGMQPSTGQILELAWISEKCGPRSFLLRLPEGDELSHKVKEITGISMEEMRHAIDEESALCCLEADLAAIGDGAVVVAHYAQFERAFLKDMFRIRRGLDEPPFSMLCTYRIAQRLFPEIPSRNIRGVAGYFELASGELKRAAEHASATAAIWERLANELAAMGLHSFPELESWLASTKVKKATKIEYRVDRLKRLELPERPGVYRMLSKSGRVLYVGKATSLKSRVNSYFRGQKGRNRKKLEMLAQVVDVSVTECETALEAALLENEEIKHHNPPYNVSLKLGRRELVFYSRDFHAQGRLQGKDLPLGPFSRSNALEQILLWQRNHERPAQVFYEMVPEEVLREGNRIFCELHGLDPRQAHPIRVLVKIGMKELRERLKLEAALELLEPEEVDEEIDGKEKEPGDTPRTPEEIAGFYNGLILRAASELRRARKLTQMLNVRVRLEGKALELRGGRIWRPGEALPEASPTPWSALDITDYDRINVLLAEVNRNSYPVETPGAS